MLGQETSSPQPPHPFLLLAAVRREEGREIGSSLKRKWGAHGRVGRLVDDPVDGRRPADVGERRDRRLSDVVTAQGHFERVGLLQTPAGPAGSKREGSGASGKRRKAGGVLGQLIGPGLRQRPTVGTPARHARASKGLSREGTNDARSGPRDVAHAALGEVGDGERLEGDGRACRRDRGRVTREVEERIVVSRSSRGGQTDGCVRDGDGPARGTSEGSYCLAWKGRTAAETAASDEAARARQVWASMSGGETGHEEEEEEEEELVRAGWRERERGVEGGGLMIGQAAGVVDRVKRAKAVGREGGDERWCAAHGAETRTQRAVWPSRLDEPPSGRPAGRQATRAQIDGQAASSSSWFSLLWPLLSEHQVGQARRSSAAHHTVRPQLSQPTPAARARRSSSPLTLPTDLPPSQPSEARRHQPRPSPTIQRRRSPSTIA